MSGSRAGRLPERLGIYYGWPSVFDGAPSAGAAAEALCARFDLLVIGWGLHQRRHPDHRATARILGDIAGRAPRVLGYVPLGGQVGLSPRQIRRACGAWRKLGVQGVLLDEAGYDFGNTRRRQNEALAAVHGEGLTAMVNAWDPDDLLDDHPVEANAAGVPLGLTDGDLLLYESYRCREGHREAISRWRARIERLDRRPPGVGLVGVATAGARFDPLALEHVVYCALLDGLDAVGWGEPAFGASGQMPHRPWPELPAVSSFSVLGPAWQHGTTYRRETSLGTVVVDLEGGGWVITPPGGRARRGAKGDRDQ